MMNFPFRPEGYTPSLGWRPLRRRAKMQRGWDVFDLQCRLAYVGHKLARDGWFGDETEKTVHAYQEVEGLVADGIAGVVTQTQLGADCAVKSARGHLARRVLGQMSKESSLLCGIYTPTYANGSQDRGPVQMNSQYYPDPEVAFDVSACLPVLVERIKAQRKRYVGWGVEEQRAWAAGQGHWNNPSWADKYARGEDVPWFFVEYIESVTALV